MDSEKSSAAHQGQRANDGSTIPKLKALLSAKDDTQKFVGLALLKSVLDNSPQIRDDEAAVQDLWVNISPKFLDRLLRTGSNPSNENSKEMLSLVISILHTFSILLPSKAASDNSFTGRIPSLIGAAVYRYEFHTALQQHTLTLTCTSSKETTDALLQTLSSLVNHKQGAQVLLKVEDLSPLTELAASHATALDVFSYAWLNVMVETQDKRGLASNVDQVMQKLVASFTGTDGVTLLEFIGSFFQQADTAVGTCQVEQP
jgi:hypothetical protein